MGTITVRIDDKVKKRLQKLAESTARTKSYLISTAIDNYLEVNEWQVGEIEKGIGEADEGRLLEHSAVMGKWEKKLANTMDKKGKRKS